MNTFKYQLQPTLVWCWLQSAATHGFEGSQNVAYSSRQPDGKRTTWPEDLIRCEILAVMQDVRCEPFLVKFEVVVARLCGYASSW